MSSVQTYRERVKRELDSRGTNLISGRVITEAEENPYELITKITLGSLSGNRAKREDFTSPDCASTFNEGKLPLLQTLSRNRAFS